MSTPPTPAARQTRRQIGRALRELLRLGPEVHRVLAHRVGVGPTDLAALDRLTATPTPMGVVELGDSLGIRSASATVLVDRLVAAGHLQRDPHPSDGRRRVVTPTASAHQDMLAALHPLISRIGTITDRLDPADADTVLAFLHEVCQTLNAFLDDSTGEPANDNTTDP